jgi:abortive infection bacteriophage resistance protein
MLIKDRESNWKKKKEGERFCQATTKTSILPSHIPVTPKTCVGVNEFVFKRVFFFFFLMKMV